jgi:Ca2+-binding RTX toxin-like protein
MAHFTVTGSNDMSTLDLSTISNGDVKTNTSSQIVIKATDGTQYALSGEFGGGDGSTLPTSGLIESWVSVAPDGSRVAINGLDLPVADFDHFLNTGNATALQNEMFSGDDTFNLAAGSGQNTVLGAAGDDVFNMGGTLDAQDAIDGGGGYNTVALDGTYAGLTLGDTTLTNIDKLVLKGNDVYDITTADGTVAANHTLFVDAKTVGSGGSITFDGSAETDGRFDFFLGAAAGIHVSGGAGNDIFHGGGAGASLSGGAGNDNFIFGGNFDGGDTINGGAGYNVVDLRGDYSAGLTFGATSLQNIDKIVLETHNSYDLTLSAANVMVGDQLKVDAHLLGGTNTLTFDGSLSTGTLILDGGTGNDTLTGGSGANNIKGGDGIDTLTAGAAADRFIYTDVHQSTGTQHDIINGFDANQDSFVLNMAVSAIDTAVTTGALSSATFNGNLGHAVGAAQLGAHDAVLFTASSGTLSGDTFLVVDENGVAGYQSNADLVIQLTGSHHLTNLSTADFTIGN